MGSRATTSTGRRRGGGTSRSSCRRGGCGRIRRGWSVLIVVAGEFKHRVGSEQPGAGSRRSSADQSPSRRNCGRRASGGGAISSSPCQACSASPAARRRARTHALSCSHPFRSPSSTNCPPHGSTTASKQPHTTCSPRRSLTPRSTRAPRRYAYGSPRRPTPFASRSSTMASAVHASPPAVA
jgi:hypothetical protein